MQRDDTPRVYDPVKELDKSRDRTRWRVILRTPEGARRYRLFTTEAQAQEFVQTYRGELKKLQARSVEEAIDLFMDALKTKETTKHHRETTLLRLRGFFQDHLEKALHRLTFEQCVTAYSRYQVRKDGRPRAAATHQGALSQSKSFLAWCVAKDFLEKNPAEKVEPVGKRKRGKFQMRASEAKKWLQEAALCYLMEGREGPLAAMMSLLLGLRSSEVLRRCVRDVDSDATLLWVSRSTTKTDAGERRIEIPPLLRPYLQRQIKGRGGEELLFGKHDSSWILDWTKRLCRRAGVPVVTAQSLRGLHASLALTHGVSAAVVAQSLGHASPAVTLGHYAAPGTQQSGSSKTVLRMLDGGNLVPPPVPPAKNSFKKRRVPRWSKRFVSDENDKENLS